MTWLVTGGAGYIGSHVASALVDVAEPVVVLDDLSTGLADRLECIAVAGFVHGSVLDEALVQRTIAAHNITGIVHLAAKKQPAESLQRPMRYYRQNVEGLRVMLDCATDFGINQFVFSSSAAVYGPSDTTLVDETDACRPATPYGQTKLVGEWMVRAAAHSDGLRYVNLRYFNVAGAARPELADVGAFNLVPMAFERICSGRAPQIFGDDYPTADGSCVRDYVHVSDIASAHVSAARALKAGAVTELTANVGRGEGVSVKQMLAIIAKVTSADTGRPVEPVVNRRRPGDPASVVAAAGLIRKELDWTAKYGVHDMVDSAWRGWLNRRMHPAARKIDESMTLVLS